VAATDFSTDASVLQTVSCLKERDFDYRFQHFIIDSRTHSTESRKSVKRVG